jgi:hypothetical protein
MRVFKFMAVAFMLLFIGAATVHAQVEVSCDGKGQALIYGYYNVRDAENDALNYLRIVNTSSTRGAAVIVTLREARTSRECLDFFVCLSPKDEWKAWIQPKINDAGVVNGVQVVNADNFNADPTPTAPPLDGLIPAEGVGPECTEGYVTIISQSAWDEVPGQRTVATSEACAAQVESLVAGSGYPGNALIGDMHLFEADIDDALYAYNATALRNFRDPAQGAIQDARRGLDFPTLGNADGGIAAVDAALSKEAAYIMHTLDYWHPNRGVVYRDDNDFIVLFPTKNQSFPGETVNFKGWKWDNNEHGEFDLGFFSPEPDVPPDPFDYELNYVTIGFPPRTPLFPTNVLWGNFEPRLMDQGLLNLVRELFGPAGLNQADVLAAVDAATPTYINGFLDLIFMNDTGSERQARPAIVLRFEAVMPVNDPMGRVWTHALEAQYRLGPDNPSNPLDDSLDELL